MNKENCIKLSLILLEIKELKLYITHHMRLGLESLKIYRHFGPKPSRPLDTSAPVISAPPTLRPLVISAPKTFRPQLFSGRRSSK